MRPLAIVGPTASGKTRRAVELARHFNGEIISADSRQVYRGMTIGTGKDLGEYGDVPVHMLDIQPAGYRYNLHQYIRDFRKAYADILNRGKLPVICGGTGLYVETALSGVTLPDVPANQELRNELDSLTLEELTERLSAMKRLHNTTDVDTKARAIRAIEIEIYYQNHPEQAAQADRSQAQPLDALIIGIDIPREERRRKISQRLSSRLEEGLIEEVEGLLASGIAPEDLIYYGLEYKFVTLYCTGVIDRATMEHDLEIAIHQFAKRQMTWFRGMEKRGFQISWLPHDMDSDAFIDAVTRLSGFHEGYQIAR